MVYGFVIHTVGASPGGDPGLCRVLYSRIFRSDILDENLRSEENNLERERLRRKEQMAIVSRQSESMCLLMRQASGRPASDFVLHSPDEPVSLHEDDVGVYGLAPGDPFSQGMSVLWAGVFSFCFSLICETHDNLTLAESTLKLLVRHLVDSLKLLTHSSNVVLKADKVEMSLNMFLPHGQLLFLNHQAVLALEKEMSSSVVY